MILPEKEKSPFIYVVLFLLFLLAVATFKHEYLDIYKLSLHGKVEKIELDIKNQMLITIANEEYNLEHNWPRLQKNIAIGDSIYKKSGEYDFILVKMKPKYRIACEYGRREWFK